MNTDTPETDAQHSQFAMGGFTLDFCRKLERERDEWQALATQYSVEREHNAMQALAYEAELDRLDVSGIHSCHANCQKTMCVMRRELTAVTEQRDKLKAQLTQTRGAVTISRNGYVQELEERRTRIREQRDKLAEALRGLKKVHSVLWDHEYAADEAIAADEALQSLNQPTEP